MKYLKLEFRRMLKSRGMAVALLIGLAFVISHMKVVLRYAQANEFYDRGEMSIPFSAFMFFMGYDMYGTQGSVYFNMTPLLAALPYANSYFRDISEGYVKNLLARGDKKKYLVAKYVAVFVSGGMAVTIPLVLDIMMCTALLPAYPPNPGTGLFVLLRNLLFVTHPWLFVALFLLVDFLIGGIYAVSTLLVTDLIENRYLMLVFPYMFMIVWQFVSVLTVWLPWPVQLSIPEQYGESVLTYATVIGGMIVVTFAVHYIRGMRRDAF